MADDKTPTLFSFACTACSTTTTAPGQTVMEAMSEAMARGWSIKNLGTHNELRCPSCMNKP